MESLKANVELARMAARLGFYGCAETFMGMALGDANRLQRHDLKRGIFRIRNKLRPLAGR
ncbi:hypothetical protein [Manganibacter manganicus]|uniref:Uncharacterized protein n=1 Tax=Manganibacter manganicus TaxID=1873176 RepID=A0A1V8RP16_9HYPH|nr:hypothetical protein [Pseudaminobacter manganicus]OQM74935.1 hypothetical protein BFN67_04790 [Pseudaminobacter manganicus]